MGSQGLDPDGGRALVGCSDGACSPHGPGELRGCHPGRPHHVPAGKHGITLVLIKGLSALALLDKQDRAQRIQQLGRGPLGISASSQALPCPASSHAIRVPTARPQPCRPPRGTARPWQAGFGRPRGGLDIRRRRAGTRKAPSVCFTQPQRRVPLRCPRSKAAADGAD